MLVGQREKSQKYFDLSAIWLPWQRMEKHFFLEERLAFEVHSSGFYSPIHFQMIKRPLAPERGFLLLGSSSLCFTAVEIEVL